MMSLPTIFSTQDYILPEWSSLPQYNFSFQIIKDGCFVQSISIREKQFHLIGRLEDLCDIYINNPTVSRKHAILQFKKNDQYPYLYDLGGTHGCEVNRKKLPVRVYQKISPFDSIKFGVSSRTFIYRCPELQQKLQQSPNEEQKKQFQDLLAENKAKLSQEQLKQKYMQMLQNDPYHAANMQNQSGTFTGQKKKDQNINGVDWGISDEYQVYAYRNQNQFPIQPNLIRRLPGIDQIQLNKLSQYEDSLRRYEQIQQQLNQLGNKEKKQYGLEEKLREKKQKTQKKFVQALEALQKNQEWIRTNVFGQKQKKKNAALKQKQTDTFQDDEFLDRTLAQKHKKDNNNHQKDPQLFTTTDYWKLDKQMRSLLKQIIEKQSLDKTNTENQDKQRNQGIEQEDQLDEFMKENNEDLAKQNEAKQKTRYGQKLQRLNEIKKQLIKAIGESEVQRIEDQERGIKPKKGLSSEQKKIKKQKQNFRKIDRVLNKLQRIQEQNEELDEEDVQIFKLYKKEAEQQDHFFIVDSQINVDKRSRDILNETQLKEYENPKFKNPKLKVERDIDQEQDYVDLTKKFN